eukprot:gene6924-biopygen15005
MPAAYLRGCPCNTPSAQQGSGLSRDWQGPSSTAQGPSAQQGSIVCHSLPRRYSNTSGLRLLWRQNSVWAVADHGTF